MSNLSHFQEKFRLSELSLFETDYWVASLRPTQPTIGSCILSLKRTSLSLGSVTPGEGSDFPTACAKLEMLLTSALGAEKFNYLALMMVDRLVHFHVIPRYSEPVRYLDQEYRDLTWPKPADIFFDIQIDVVELCNYLRLRQSANQEYSG